MKGVLRSDPSRHATHPFEQSVDACLPQPHPDHRPNAPGSSSRTHISTSRSNARAPQASLQHAHVPQPIPHPQPQTAGQGRRTQTASADPLGSMDAPSFSKKDVGRACLKSARDGSAAILAIVLPVT